MLEKSEDSASNDFGPSPSGVVVRPGGIPRDSPTSQHSTADEKKTQSVKSRLFDLNHLLGEYGKRSAA